jgi:hypothetical protein
MEKNKRGYSGRVKKGKKKKKIKINGLDIINRKNMIRKYKKEIGKKKNNENGCVDKKMKRMKIKRK